MTTTKTTTKTTTETVIRTRRTGTRRIMLDPDGWTELHCGGAVRCEGGQPVRVSDGAREGVSADGETAWSTPAEPTDIIDDLRTYGWIVELGEWDQAQGEPDCTADVVSARRRGTAREREETIMTGMIIRNDEGHCGPEVYEPFSGSITDLEIELRRHDTGSCLCCLPRFRGEYRGRRVSGEINVDVEGDFHVYELATE